MAPLPWNGYLVRLKAGSGITIDQTDPGYPEISATGGGGGGVSSVVAGDNITVDSTDPANPIVAALAVVAALVAGESITIDNTDPANPVVSLSNHIGSDGTDFTLDADSFYFKIASAGLLILNAGNIAIQGGAIFNPGHLATVSLPDPADHVGGIAWDSTTLSLAVSDGSSWKHLGSGVPASTDSSIVYANDGSGTPTPLDYADENDGNPAPGTIVQRTSDGSIIADVASSGGGFLTAYNDGTTNHPAAYTGQGATLPSYTDADITAHIPTESAGNLIFNGTTSKLNFYSGTAWVEVTSP